MYSSIDKPTSPSPPPTPATVCVCVCENLFLCVYVCEGVCFYISPQTDQSDLI